MKLGLFGLALIISLGSTVSVADSRDLAGHYYLQGVMEMASELVLRKDGTFSSGIMYGSAEGYDKGSWEVSGDTLILKSETPPTTRIALEIEFVLNREKGLAVTEAERQEDKEQYLHLAKNNYVLNMFYVGFSSLPAINPVSVYWKFDGGAVRQQIWTDSTQAQLLQPFNVKSILMEVGFQVKGSRTPIQWVEVTPTARWIDIHWSELYSNQEGNLSEMLRDMNLTIKPGCLVFELGDSKACFRKKG